jgi:hypothetical protein
MKESMMNAAYEIARDNYKVAAKTTFLTLDSQFGHLGFDEVHRAAAAAMMLHITSMALAERIWSQSIPYQKATEILSSQFPDFSTHTLEAALGSAYSDSR